MPNPAPLLKIRTLYDRFDAPVVPFDCGEKCTPHNPSGKPFCCDICHAVPAAFHQEWQYLQLNTDLWHAWRGDECPADPTDPAELRSDTPQHMLLLACTGPAHCQREYRLLSCRQFPFFPYVTVNYRFIGLSYEWAFEPACWVISHLDQVTVAFREEFTRVYDELFAHWEDELESYAILSEQARQRYAALRRRIPLLHRNGGFYLFSPGSERLRRTSPQKLRRFGPYRLPG